MKRLLLCAVAAITLSGCVSFGISQKESETTYTFAVIAADVSFGSGQITANAAGQICLIDNANYKILSATRGALDGVDHTPADSAHATLQHDGARLNPAQCDVGSALPG